MSSESSSGRRRLVYDIGDVDAEGFISEEERDVLPDRAPDGVRRRSYDKAFEPAVAEGLLTVQAAWARGSRDAYAIGLQRRYELSSTLAYDVADNRISLLEALEILDRQQMGILPELTGSYRRLHWHLIPLAVVLAGLLFLSGQYGEQLWERQGRIAQDLEQLSFVAARRARAAAVSTEPVGAPVIGLKVERNELGQVTRVSAGRPTTVLEEICRLASSAESCEWMEVRHTEPRYPGHRVGRFALTRGDAQSWVVRIRRDRTTGRWFVGTGLRPIEPVPVDGDRPVPGLDPQRTPSSTLAASLRRD